MAKRFTDTDKYKKPFIRSLPVEYKVLWDYLYHECNHAGIWIVDFEIAKIYINANIDKKIALELFNKNEIRIIELNHGSKWFIPSFIDFQYGQLNENNRAHNSVIQILKKYNLIDNKGLVRGLQGCKDMDKDMDKEKDKDKNCLFKNNYNNFLLKYFKQEIINKTIWQEKKQRNSFYELIKKFDNINDFVIFLNKAEYDKWLKDRGFIPSDLISQYSSIQLKNEKNIQTKYNEKDFEVIL